MANTNTSDYRYFIYSSDQMKFQKKMEEKVSKTYQVGTVIVNGKKRSFTELSKTGVSTYSDAVIVAEGSLKKFKYTLPKGL